MPTNDEPRAELLAIGAAVRRRRNGLGWSLEELAAESGVSRRTIINIESGRHAAGIDNLLDIARALGVSLARIVDEADIGED